MSVFNKSRGYESSLEVVDFCHKKRTRKYVFFFSSEKVKELNVRSPKLPDGELCKANFCLKKENEGRKRTIFSSCVRTITKIKRSGSGTSKSLNLQRRRITISFS